MFFTTSIEPCSEEHTVYLGQELINEWQSLFHKAKMFDSVMIKQVIKNKTSFTKIKKSIPYTHSVTSFVGHYGEGVKPIRQICKSLSDDLQEYIDVRSNKLKLIKSLTGKLRNVTAENRQLMFVSTDELLEIKRCTQNAEETFC